MTKQNSLNRYSDQFEAGADAEGTSSTTEVLNVRTDQDALTAIGCFNRNNTVAEVNTYSKVSCHGKLNSDDSLTEGGIAIGNDLFTGVGSLGTDAQNRLCLFSNVNINGITYRSGKASTSHIWTIGKSGDNGVEIMRLETAGLSFDAGTNHLDTYTEGTFTPDVTGSVSNPTTGWTTALGYYTRIGNTVKIHLILIGDGSTYTGGSGNLEVSGLPFASPNTSQGDNVGAVLCFKNLDHVDTATQVNAVVEQNASNFLLQEQSDNAGQSNCSVGDLANDGRIYISGTYFTT